MAPISPRTTTAKMIMTSLDVSGSLSFKSTLILYYSSAWINWSSAFLITSSWTISFCSVGLMYSA